MRIEEDYIRKQLMFEAAFGNRMNKGNLGNAAESFKNILTEELNSANNKLLEADAAENAFVKGEEVSIDEVMAKNTEAMLTLNFLAAARDKIIDGYQQISKQQL